jgi:coenzyme F420-reducing hydrogenase gamma subunit
VNVVKTEYGLDVNQNVKVKTFVLSASEYFHFYLIEIRCPPLKNHPRVIQECLPQQNNTKLQFGTKCQAKCNETGYRMIGPRIRECLSISKWTGYEQFCIGKRSTIDRKEISCLLLSWC